MLLRYRDSSENAYFCHMFGKIRLPLLFLILTLLVSCGKYQKLLKSTDNELKYEKAVAYYQKGDFYRAQQLFDQLIPIVRGTDKAEMLHYYYASSHYEQKDYVLASYYFKRFARNYPNSQYAEECSFMGAYCLYLQSPSSALDQTPTLEAINELQLFVNLYPASKRIEECNQLIDELRIKLEEKDYGIARLYFKMQEYKAAIVAYENVLKDFPSSRYKEQILYDIFKSYVYFAQMSIPEKQAERYAGARDAYITLLTTYPNSKFIKEAQNLHRSIPGV